MSGAGPREPRPRASPSASCELASVSCLFVSVSEVRTCSFVFSRLLLLLARDTQHGPCSIHSPHWEMRSPSGTSLRLDVRRTRLRLPGDSSRRLVFRVPDCRAPARASATATLSLHTAVPRYSAVSPHLPAAASPLACATLCDASPRPSSFQPLASSFSPCSSCLLGLRFASRPRRPRFTLPPPPASLT